MQEGRNPYSNHNSVLMCLPLPRQGIMSWAAPVGHDSVFAGAGVDINDLLVNLWPQYHRLTIWSKGLAAHYAYTVPAPCPPVD